MTNNIYHDEQYLKLLRKILDEGVKKEDRTGTGTLSLFGETLKFDVSQRVPILTSKKIHLPSVIHELLWFVSGSTNVKYLQKNGVTIWDAWSDPEGNLGPVYGQQWRAWPTGQKRWISSSEWEPDTLDQLQKVIDEIRKNPNSRRLLVSAWNAPLVWNGSMALPPCHHAFLFNVAGDEISLMFTIRSNDYFLGNPFNIASYAMLLYMVASVTGYKPKWLICSMGDVHLYLNHLAQANEQLGRIGFAESPSLLINPDIKEIDDFKFEDFEIANYSPMPAIRASIAV